MRPDLIIFPPPASNQYLSLSELRELVRNEQIDVVIIYCLDRLSREPTDGVILTQELEKHGITLEAVTEDVENTDLGKLINYIRGFASKLEAAKIKERTARGRKAKALQGKIPSGGYRGLYGYDYIELKEKNGGRRVINEAEAVWVRKMFQWLVEEGMSTYAITRKLNSLNVATKRGCDMWIPKTVHGVLTNRAYTGKTTYTDIELSPDLTPQLITEAMFDAAQKQLKLNYERASRNTKREYLLHGHVYCSSCRRPYWAHSSVVNYNHIRYQYRWYLCSNRVRQFTKVNRCDNRGWNADTLEQIVWQEIEKLLAQPDIIIAEIEKQRQQADRTNHIEDELKQVRRQIKAKEKEQQELLQWALKGFPEETILETNKAINSEKANLLAQEQELYARLKSCQEAAVNLPKMEQFISLVKERLVNLDFEAKWLALEALSVKIWVGSDSVEITGSIPIQDFAIVQTPTRQPRCQ